MRNIKKYFREFYRILLITLGAAFLWQIAINTERYGSLLTGLSRSTNLYLMNNLAINIAVLLIIFAPAIFWILRHLLRHLFPTINNAIAQIAKAEKLVAQLLGMSAGLLSWLILEIINGNNSSTEKLSPVIGLLFVLTICVIMFRIEHDESDEPPQATA